MTRGKVLYNIKEKVFLLPYGSKELEVYKALPEHLRKGVKEIIISMLCKAWFREEWRRNRYDILIDAIQFLLETGGDYKEARKRFYEKYMWQNKEIVLSNDNCIEGNPFDEETTPDSLIVAFTQKERGRQKNYHKAKAVKPITVRLPKRAWEIIQHTFNGRRNDFISALISVWEIHGDGKLVDKDRKDLVKNIPIKVKLTDYWKLLALAKKHNTTVPKVILMMWNAIEDIKYY